MAKYIKHYYVDDDTNTFCCGLEEPGYIREPWKEYDGLDIKISLSDSEGVPAAIAELPDSTYVVDVEHECGKKAVKVLTITEYNSVATPYFEAFELYREAMELQHNEDTNLFLEKKEEADLKYAEALNMFHLL